MDLPFHWWKASQYFIVITLGNGDCVLVVLAFVFESWLIESMLCWRIDSCVSFYLCQYAYHVIIHSVFLFLSFKYFRVIEAGEGSRNIHGNLHYDILLLDHSKVRLKKVDAAFFNQGRVCCFLESLNKILNFLVHELWSSHQVLD